MGVELQQRSQGTVWTEGGCASWYLDRNGRNATIWPGFSWSFRRATRQFDPESYVFGTRVAGPMPVAA